MSNYLITAVRYNNSEAHIVKVRTHTDNGDSMGPVVDLERATVVNRIESGGSFKTAYKQSDGTYRRGAEVRVVTIEGTKYLRTDADRIKKDNLGSLPRF
jgi:hypothetical protein